MKARVYRVFAMVFVIVGLLVFIQLYLTKVEGRLAEAIRDPFMVTIFLVPFLPAAVLSLLATRLERKLISAIKKEEAAAAKKDEPAKK